MANGQKKSNVLIYVILLIVILGVVGFVYKDQITKMLKGDKSETQVTTPEENPIDKLLTEGDNLFKDKKYVEAKDKANEAKNHKKPEPTTEQHDKIEELLKKIAVAEKKLKEEEDAAKAALDKEKADKEKADKEKIATKQPVKIVGKPTIDPGAKKLVAKTLAKRKRRYGRKIPTKKIIKPIIKKPVVKPPTDPIDKPAIKPTDPIDKPAIKPTDPVDKPVTTDPDISTPPVDPVETPAGDNEIDELIKEAKELGGNQEYTDAISKLNEAKVYNDPKPSEVQKTQIEELLSKYGTALIDSKISQAQKLADEEKSYRDAISQLKEIKAMKSPNPTSDQQNLIDELINKYNAVIVDGKIAEAVKRGNEEKEYKDAIAKLEDIKKDTDPKPNTEQMGQIDEHIKKFNDAENLRVKQEKEKLANELFKQGKQELANGNNDEAIRLFNEALKNNPEHVLAHSYKGTAFYNLKDKEKALAASEEALKRQADEPNAHLTKGNIYYDDLKDSQADEEFNQVIAKDPKNAMAYFKLGVIKLQAKQDQEALSMFDKSLAIENGLNDKYKRNAYYNRGVAKERLTKDEEAIADYKLALQTDNSYAKAYVQLGEIYYKKKEYKKAVDSLNQGISSASDNFEIAFLLGKTYDAMAGNEKSEQPVSPNPEKPKTSGSPGQEDTSDSSEDTKEPVESTEPSDTTEEKATPTPESKDKEISTEKSESEHLDNALSYYVKAVDLNKKSAEALFNASRIYILKKEYENAVSYLNKALELKKDDFAIHAALGEAYYGNKNYDESIKNFTKALELNPQTQNANLGLGAAYFARSKKDDGKYNEEDLKNASLNLEKVLEKDTGNFHVNKALGTIYFHLKRYDDAIKVLEKAVSLKKEDTNTRLNLANIYFANKMYDKAAPHYAKVIETKGDDAELHLRVVQCHYMSNDKANVKKWVDTLVSKFPDYQDKRQVRFYKRMASNT